MKFSTSKPRPKAKFPETKTSSNPKIPAQAADLDWNHFTHGPFLVPVTRWIE